MTSGTANRSASGRLVIGPILAARAATHTMPTGQRRRVTDENADPGREDASGAGDTGDAGGASDGNDAGDGSSAGMHEAVATFLSGADDVYDEYDRGYVDADAALAVLSSRIDDLRDAAADADIDGERQEG